MATLFVLAFIVLIGPLAALCGVDSRKPNDGWRGWPASHDRGRARRPVGVLVRRAREQP